MTGHARNDEIEKGTRGFFAREAVSGVPWMVLSKLILFVVYFCVGVLTVNGLGKEQYGVYSLMVNLASYLLVLGGLGLCTALMRYIPELATRRNRWALGHLLWKSATLQLVAVMALSLLVIGLAGPLQKLFRAEQVGAFRFYVKLACGLTALLLLKDYVGTVFTSLFKVRTVAILSVVQGVIWLVTLFVVLDIRPSIGAVVSVQMFSVGLVYLFGAIVLFRYIRSLPWEVREFGIGKRRALSFSGSVMLNSILRMVMFKYSEIFFLAAVGGTTLAGMYDLGYSLPYIAITFIPLALLPLFTSAFAEAYTRDHDCLSLLISSYYKLLMMVSLPLAVLGLFFAPDAYHILYRGEMDESGRLAAAFSLVLMLPLISMPLSAAIKAKEKILNMVPMLILQIIVNLLLDWILIVHCRLGMWGGVGAVVSTFLITIPFRLMVVRNILGGVYFPVRFFLRVFTTLMVEGVLFCAVTKGLRLFERFENQWINIGFLFLTGGLYLGLFLVLVRQHGVVRQEDIEDFHALEIERLNKVLRFLVK